MLVMLGKHNIGQYYDGLMKDGWDDVEALRLIGEEELVKMAWKPGHARKRRSALGLLQCDWEK